MMLGYMAMPADFRYRAVVLRGKPRHEKTDAFSIRHPPMPPGRWAKIFSPFDALKGFSDAIAAKDVRYADREVLCEEDQARLDRQLEMLHDLTWTARMARENHVRASVEYYVPCADPNSFAYGLQGTYETVSGVVRNVDAEITRTLRIDSAVIPIEDIRSIRTDCDKLLETEWDEF